MIMKFQAKFNPSQGGTETIGQFQKASGSKIAIAVDYSNVLKGIDFISSCTITAADLDGNDVTATIVEEFLTGNRVTGTATGGSTSTLIDTNTDFIAKGVTISDNIVNVTKGYRSAIASIATQVADEPYSVLSFFDTNNLAAANSDTYHLFFCPVYIKAGTDGTDYEITFTMTANSGLVLTKKVLVNVVG